MKSATKNKFAHPPYLPSYDPKMAATLERILQVLSKTCCRFQNIEGALVDLDLLTTRSSQIRKADLYKLKDIVQAVLEFDELFGKLVKEKEMFE